MANMKVAEPEPTALVAMTVYAVETCCVLSSAAPEMTPVEVFNDNPLGSAGVILHEVAVPADVVRV